MRALARELKAEKAKQRKQAARERLQRQHDKAEAVPHQARDTSPVTPTTRTLTPSLYDSKEPTSLRLPNSYQ